MSSAWRFIFSVYSLGYRFTTIGLCDTLARPKGINRFSLIQWGDMKPILRKMREHGVFTAICIYLLYVIRYLLVLLLDILSLHPELEWLSHVSYWLDFTWLYFFLPT